MDTDALSRLATSAIDSASGSGVVMDALSNLAISAIGAAAGSGVALLGAFWVYKRQYRDALTQRYIDEFYSISFLIHRIEAAKVQRWILEDDPAAQGKKEAGFMH